MHTTAAFVDSAAIRDRRPWFAATVVSLLLHALAAWWLLGAPWWWREAPPQSQPMVVEMVTVPAPVPPEPALMTQSTLPAVPPPPPPQLSEAPIAERSMPPPTPRSSPQPARPRADSPPTVSPGQRSTAALPPRESGESTPLEAERIRPGGTPPEAIASQTVQDVILKQISRHWIIDVRGPTYRDVVLTVRFNLLPSGMLGPPFGRNDPWDLRAMLADYDGMMRPENRILRTAVETFLLAMRQAQPFQLPPDGRSDEERILPLSFRLRDL